MCLRVSYKKKTIFLHLKKEFSSGSVGQRYGSADPDPDPHQNVTDSQHWNLHSNPATNTHSTLFLLAKQGAKLSRAAFGLRDI